MNKYQEALDTIFDFYKESHIEGKFLLRSSIDSIQELVDRATPMKLKDTDSIPRCKCRAMGHAGNARFCWYCGQALDWGGEK